VSFGKGVFVLIIEYYNKFLKTGTSHPADIKEIKQRQLGKCELTN
jgi:hypothetical protein